MLLVSVDEAVDDVNSSGDDNDKDR